MMWDRVALEPGSHGKMLLTGAFAQVGIHLIFLCSFDCASRMLLPPAVLSARCFLLNQEYLLKRNRRRPQYSAAAIPPCWH